MIAITNGKILTVTKGVIDQGTILVEDGLIKAIGQNLAIPESAQVIDASGKWITPGLIDAHSHISLWAEPATMPGPCGDFNEMSDPVTPQLRGLDALNPDDIAIKKVREAGFTTLYTGPGSANIIGGLGLSIKLRGLTAEDMFIQGSEQMKMALGENPKRVYGLDKKAPMTRMAVASILRETLAQAKRYSDALLKADLDPKAKRPEYDCKSQALLKVVRGEQRVRIHCHRADDIMTAIRISEEFGLDFVLEHVTGGHKIKDVLAAKKVRCVVGPLLLGPVKQEVWEGKIENAGLLAKAGVKIALMADEAGGTRWLPSYAGIAVRYGLAEEEALKALTINSAEILGLDHRLGSLEPGKDADLAIFDGNPLHNMTSCLLTMIDGEVHYNQL